MKKEIAIIPTRSCIKFFWTRYTNDGLKKNDWRTQVSPGVGSEIKKSKRNLNTTDMFFVPARHPAT